MKNSRYLLCTLILLPLFAVSQWTPVNGPSETRARGIALLHGKIFLATNGAGISKSENDGESWSKLSNYPDSIYSFIYSLIVHNDKLYSGDVDAIYCSLDDGDSWSSISSGLPFPNYYSHLLFDVNGTLYCGAYIFNLFSGTYSGGLFQYDDILQDWNPVPNLPYDQAVITMAGNENGIYVGLTNEGIWKSANHGASWDPINAGLSNLYVEELEANDDAIYAGISGGGIYKSGNSGATWDLVLQGGPFLTGIEMSHDTLCAAYTNYIYVSFDGGATWPNQNHDRYYEFLDIKISPNKIFAADDAMGFFISPDFGLQWHQSNQGLNHAVVYHLNKEFDKLIACDYINAFSSGDGGDSWNLYPPEFWNVQGITRMGNKLIADINYGNIYNSFDEGATWQLNTEGNTGILLQQFLVDNEHRKLYAQNPSDIVRSDDYGIHWQHVYHLNSYDTTITSFTRVHDKLFITMNAGSNSFHLLSSSDSGENWSDIPINQYIACVLNVNDTLVINVYDGIEISTDEGVTFQFVSGAQFANYYFINGSTIITYENPYGNTMKYTTNFGQTWTDISPPAAVNNILNVTMDSEFLYIGTYANSVWKRRLSEMGLVFVPDTSNNYQVTSVVDSPAMDSTGVVIFPNPFSLQTTLQFTLPQQERVKIEMFDMQGRKLFTIADDWYGAGVHRIAITKNLSAGSYIIRTMTGDKKYLNKIISY